MRPAACVRTLRSLCAVLNGETAEVEKTAVENRREERISASLPVNLGSTTGVTRNVSASGISFETDVSYGIGNPISFAVHLDAPGGKMVLKCRGEIVRVEPRGKRVGVAVKVGESVLEAVS